ncbi:cobalamin biosynthesis protein [Nocardia pseudobrasiliensis]|uniref:Cobalt-precorrin 5A hydrolase n=1 Tax=Nocardia pseudobrasiliensis TaxID=45979 RepID=A0A370I2R4_9NOCA|nr:cobalamin biosynthesis protein [Nocardia pseudobrasiliensis]RDI64996.1 cobalt-precorrin 5A hydrolase [Nocardia pseudobrasiliensis]
MAELAVGIGFRPGASTHALLAAIRAVTGSDRIHCLATVDRRAADSALIDAATELVVPIVGFSVEELAGVRVPNPSSVTTAALGIPSVAEAAALLAAGLGELFVAKRIHDGVTIAVARMPG